MKTLKGAGAAPAIGASGVSGGNLFTTAQALIFTTDALTGNNYAGGTFELVTPAATLAAPLTQTLGALTPTAGNGMIQVDTGNSGFSNLVSFSTFGTRAAGATLNFAPAARLGGVQNFS